jgi:hypothetical protein
MRRVVGVTALVVAPEVSAAGLRNHALGVCRGDHVLFVDASHAITEADLAAILDAHEAGSALVGVPAIASAATMAGSADLLLIYGGIGDEGVPPVEYVSFDKQALHLIHGFDEELEHGFEAVAARVLIGLGLTATMIETDTRARVGGGGVLGLIRRQYNLGRGLSRARAIIGDTGTHDALDALLPGRQPPAGVDRRTARLTALGAIASRLGAAREHRRMS